MTDERTALIRLLEELVNGASKEAAGVLNPGDPGLLRSLEKLSAETASKSVNGGAPIAAHADHLRYGMELLNRWGQGENPFADADYRASWRITAVSESEWTALRAALRSELSRWRESLQHSDRPLTDTESMGIVASVVHLAYHLGAMRQIDRSLRGPSAED